MLSMSSLADDQPAEEPENYCDDAKSWAEWDKLVRKHPKDMDLQTLHALRIGLCDKPS